MKRIKVIHILSDVEMSWQLFDLWKELNTNIDLHVILISRGKNMLKHELDKADIANSYLEGSSFSLLLKLMKIYSKFRPDVVHTHLRKANYLGLFSAWLMRVKRRIHTRHSSDYNHRYYPHAVKYDRLLNRISTDIVSISPVVTEVLREMESVPAPKVSEIPHGFDLARFRTNEQAQLDQVRREYNIEERGPVITVISRLLELKGIEYTIRAFKSFLSDYPDAVLLLLNSTGPYRDVIIKELDAIPESSYRLIEFEKDIPAVYAITDVYVHVPIDENCEAFGQTYIESMASMTPGVFTRSGIGGSILKHEENCLVVPYCDAEAIQNSIVRLLTNAELGKKIIRGGEVTASGFQVNSQVDKLLSLYA